MTATYTETVLRFRLVKREIMPEKHAAEAAINGCPMERDADGNPYRDGLYMSFYERADADEACRRANESNIAPDIWSYHVVDAGAAEQIERAVW